MSHIMQIQLSWIQMSWIESNWVEILNRFVHVCLLTVDKTLFAMVTLTIWTTQTVTTPLNSHTSKILDCILKKIRLLCPSFLKTIRSGGLGVVFCPQTCLNTYPSMAFIFPTISTVGLPCPYLPCTLPHWSSTSIVYYIWRLRQCGRFIVHRPNRSAPV